MKKLFFVFASLLSLIIPASAQYFPLPPSALIMRLPANEQKAITDQYRKPTKEELETLKVSLADKERYAAFLRQPETGLIKLAADFKCAENTKIVVATPECLKYSMPGAGISYSFRTENYRIGRLADLTFIDNGFQATGALTHGILVKIGDVPLEKVTLQTPGLKFLADFKPVTDYRVAQTIDKQLMRGVIHKNLVYRRALYATDDSTYILRSIAYNGKLYQSAQRLTYNEFDFDKRGDVIVAFRIVSRDADGSVTILWKKLAEKDSPKLAPLKDTAKSSDVRP